MSDFIPYYSGMPIQVGDIIETNSDYPLLHHFGIAFKRDNGSRNGSQILIADFNGEMKAWTVPAYENFRKIYGIIRNDETAKVTDEQVEEAMRNWTGFKWRTNRSCIDFVQSICPNADLGLDQRVKFALIFLGIIALFLIII
jgi:hypothetical protein